MSQLCTRCSQPTELEGGHLTVEECARHRWAPSLRLWPWREAPEQYRLLSDAGGDEELVLFCPDTLIDATWPHWLDHALAGPPASSLTERSYGEPFGWGERHTVPGGVVLIFSHS